jgi:hypothetical protein
MEGVGSLKVHQRKGEEQGANLSRTISKQTLEREEGQQWMGDKPLPEAGQVVYHKNHFLSQ